MISIKNKSVFFAICLVILLAGFANAQEDCVFDSSFAPSNIHIEPTRVVAGRTAKVQVNIFNSGTCIWHERKVKLSIKVIRKPSGSPYPLEEFKSELPLTSATYPKKSRTWYYEITGPETPGRYELEWTLTHEGKPFGERVRKTVEVVAP